MVVINYVELLGPRALNVALVADVLCVPTLIEVTPFITPINQSGLKLYITSHVQPKESYTWQNVHVESCTLD